MVQGYAELQAGEQVAFLVLLILYIQTGAYRFQEKPLVLPLDIKLILFSQHLTYKL